MVALARDRKTDQFGASDEPVPGLTYFPVAAAARLFAGGMVGLDAAGNAVPMSALATLRSVGIALKQVDNLTGAAAALNVSTAAGVFYFDSGGGADAITKANVRAVVYASDDHTVNLTDGAGARPAVGTVWGPPDSRGQIPVALGMTSLNATVELPVFTNATRPAATTFPVGGLIYNSDDFAPNVSDGTNWRDMAGVIT